MKISKKTKERKTKLSRDDIPNTSNTKDGKLIRAEEKRETGWELLEVDLKDAQSREPDAHDNTEHHRDSLPKLSKHQRKRRKLEHELDIREAEKRRVTGNHKPESVEEFEAAVLASPSSSYVWIQYMAFLIGQGSLERARQLVPRALGTIPYREDGEKFNIWVATLNTDVIYGTEEEALKTLGSALQRCDARTMYLAAVDIFEAGGKENLIEDCLKAMCRKYSGHVDVWIRAMKYRIEHGDPEKAKMVLDRSLRSLPASEHVKMISQAALLEFKKGNPERGRGLFENILRSYPRRLDLWSVYIDQEIGAGDDARIRMLFERVTYLSLPPKKMKFLFKRWLEWEKKVGGDVDKVKKRAIQFVEHASAATEAVSQ